MNAPFIPTKPDRSAVLVTGASGFVGRQVAAAIGSHGRRVVRTGRRPSGDPHYVPADLTDPAQCESLTRGVSTVVHCAGLAHQFKKPPTEADFGLANEVSTRNLLEAAVKNGAKHLVLISSSSVYGPGQKGAHEESPVVPDTPYAKSKLAAEDIARSGCAAAGMALTILRPATVYGVGDPGNVRRLIESISGRRFAMIGSGKNLKSLVAVEDLAAAVALAACRPQGPIRLYNLAAPPMTMGAVVGAIAAALGAPLPRYAIPGGLASGSTRLLALASGGRGPFARVHRTIAKWLSDDSIDAGRFERVFGFNRWRPFHEHIRAEAAWLSGGDRPARLVA